jgi:hypothetical protein
MTPSLIDKHNAQLTGKKLLAKISDKGAKANCFLSLFNLLNEAAERQKKQRSSVLLIPFNIGGALRSIVMNINDQTRFNQFYQAYLNELTLQGKSPKTIDMYSRCIRQVSVFFDTCPETRQLKLDTQT